MEILEKILTLQSIMRVMPYLLMITGQIQFRSCRATLLKIFLRRISEKFIPDREGHSYHVASTEVGPAFLNFLLGPLPFVSIKSSYSINVRSRNILTVSDAKSEP